MSEKKSFIQFDREIILKMKDTTEAIVFGYIVHEQVSSIRNNSTLRAITYDDITKRFGISKKTAQRVKNKLEVKNLLVKDSPIPNPRIGKLVWNEDDKSFDIDFIKIVKEKGFYGKEVEVGRTYNYLIPLDETTHCFDYGFIKVDKEWFENPEIDITTKYWTIFFKAFEPTKTWKPTYDGIVKESNWGIDAIKKNYYKLRDEGWIHNDSICEIPNGWDTIKAKSYCIDFVKEKKE